MGDEGRTNFLQQMQERINEISSSLIFFTIELNDISEIALTKMYKESDRLERYKPWISQIRAYKPYQLSKSIEKILHEKRLASRDNWVRLYNEIFSRIRFDLDGKKLPISDVLNFLSDVDAKKREHAAQSFSTGLKEIVPSITLIMNTIVKDKSIEDNWRKYKHPISSRNVDNQVEDDVVETLVQSVRKQYTNLSHRYYSLKAKWMGKKSIPYWDRNAPLPEAGDRRISWEEAQDIVLKAYKNFHPQLSEIAELFFKNKWIDAALRPGKDSGAFSHPMVPSKHPVILLNYHGKVRDVMTLAHELGHGIHQYLSRGQGQLMADTPLTLAETASVFGEMLTFQSLLKTTESNKQKKIIIASKVEDMLNTVVRQVAFCCFEINLHKARKEGELTSDQIGKIWVDSQKESLGPAIDLYPDYSIYWSYVSHFFHTPFYVYAYAFGDCLVNSLYKTYEKHPEGFAEKYITMLKSGGTLRHKELLKPFGLDATRSDFWDQGVSVISNLIDQLEAFEE
jgi:oligoendopeptidase F